MTAAYLLALICIAILAQVGIAVGWAMWHRRRKPIPAQDPTQILAPASAPAAWAGWRTFRISERHFEDASRSQCSFSLKPDDGIALPPFLPGQFLTFSLPGAGGNAALVRCYSISDCPRPEQYRITVKRALAPASRPDVVNRRSNGTHFGGISACKRGPLAARGEACASIKMRSACRACGGGRA